MKKQLMAFLMVFALVLVPGALAKTAQLEKNVDTSEKISMYKNLPSTVVFPKHEKEKKPCIRSALSDCYEDDVLVTPFTPNKSSGGGNSLSCTYETVMSEQGATFLVSCMEPMEKKCSNWMAGANFC